MSCAAALATLDVLEAGAIVNAARVGAHLKAGLETLAAKHGFIDEVRGLGLMLALELGEPDQVLPVLRAAFERGLLLLGCGEASVRLAPPLIVTEAEAAIAVQILDDAFHAL